MDEYKVQGEALVLSLFQESFALQTNKKRKLQFFLQTLPFEDLFCIRILVEIFLFLSCFIRLWKSIRTQMQRQNKSSPKHSAGYTS